MITSLIKSLPNRWKNRRNVKFGIGAQIDAKTKFEGKNRLGKFTSVKSSSLGYGSYIADNSRLSQTKIGRYTSIGRDVQVVGGRHPVSEGISTCPSFYSSHPQNGLLLAQEPNFRELVRTENGYMVEIGNDVWIGSHCRILQGVTVGDGAVIACGAVVTKDVPPYSVVGGVPAKVLRYRFDDAAIEQLCQLQWWNWSKETLAARAHLFMQPERFLKAAAGAFGQK